jgi:hypothetical protein
MKRNKEIERELSNVNATIKMLQTEFQQKINEVESKNNSVLKNIKQSHDDLEYMLDNHVMDIELTEKNIQQKVGEIERQNTSAFNNINQELSEFQNVVKTGFSEIISRQNTFNGHLEGNFNVLSTKIAKNTSEQNSLERQLNQIMEQIIQQQQVTQNTENQCKRFDAFLDNYSVNNMRLNKSTTIPLFQISYGIQANTLRTLHSVGCHIHLKDCENRYQISQRMTEHNSRNIFIELAIIIDLAITHSFRGEKINVVPSSIPIYMLCLLFGTKIFSIDDEDVTDLYESNFNNAKRYHDARASSNPESKRISDMCNVEIVREMFK